VYACRNMANRIESKTPAEPPRRPGSPIIIISNIIALLLLFLLLLGVPRILI